jgi:hypothetical protein
MFWRNILLPSSGLKNKPSKTEKLSLLTACQLYLLYNNKDESSTLLQKTDILLPDHTSQKAALFIVTSLRTTQALNN